MSIANKRRLFELFVVMDFIIHGIIFVSYDIKAIYIIFTVFINVFIVILLGIYWLSQKCPYCDLMLNDRSDNLFYPKKQKFTQIPPFLYLIVTGKCHHCQRKI